MLKLEKVAIRQGSFALTADWTLETGSIAAVIGPSGGGKSTLLNLIAGFVPRESGRVCWDGTDITDMPPGLRPLSMMFQDQNLFPHLSALQNAGMGLRSNLRLTVAQVAQVRGALARVGLSEMADRLPGSLSGGQQGRLALARALLRGRPLLLLDEPFAALGPALKDDMLDLVADLAREEGTTVLFVTHDPGDARRIAPLTVLVADGRAQAPTATAALLDTPPPALADYLGTPRHR